MSEEPHEPGVLPTERMTSKETVVLVRSLLVDWSVLEHLQKHGLMGELTSQMEDAGCCKPDGGTCCVNKKLA